MDVFGFSPPPAQSRGSQSTVTPGGSMSDFPPDSPMMVAMPPTMEDYGSNAAGGGGGGTNARYYNPVVMSFIRDDWIQQQLHLRQADYTVFQKTRIVTGSWNVNAKKPLLPAEAGRIVEWLDVRTTSSSRDNKPQPLPDIVALGFQEIVDLNAVNVVVNSALTVQRSTSWQEVVLAALNDHLASSYSSETDEPRHQYKLLLEKHLVGILMLVIVRTDHLEHVREVYGATAGVGIMGMMGNKGGAAVRLSFYDSTLCFVCAHLAAHRENVAGRNADYQNILSKVQFLGDGEDDCPSDMRYVVACRNDLDIVVFTDDLFTRYLSGEPPILNHDFVFWIGDLNYRIQDSVSVEEVFRQAEGDNLAELRQRDQLNVERKRGTVLQGFEEGPLTFRPTYKYQTGTSIYEKRPEKKLRAPAWCDRILWKAKLPEHVALQVYDCVMSLDLSDHKPVHASFEVQVRHQVDTKKNQVMREIMMQLDKWENENMPKVRLLQSDGATTSSGVLGFSHLRFGADQVKSVIVENTGIVVAHFRFIPKLDEVTICKPWLRVSPMFGMIPPKEQVEIRITANVDDVVAHGLSGGSETLDDTMILRIENGRDYFLVVSGQYDNSCFGSSLEQLVLCNDPIRQARFSSSGSSVAPMFSVWAGGTNSSSFAVPEQQQSVDATTGGPPAASGNSTSQKVPKELWRMVNDIYQHFMQDKNLFVEGGNKTELAQLREALDTGQPFPPHSGYSTAELLLTWLQSLRQRVVPDEILGAAISSANGNLSAACRSLLDMLPPVRYNVVIYLVSFLREVLKHSATNKLTAEKLAFVFSRCLVSPYQAASGDQPNESQQQGQPSMSAASTASTVSIGSTSPNAAVLPEERVRKNAREAELAQWNATQRAERMEAILVHLLSAPAL